MLTRLVVHIHYGKIRVTVYQSTIHVCIWSLIHRVLCTVLLSRALGYNYSIVDKLDKKDLITKAPCVYYYYYYVLARLSFYIFATFYLINTLNSIYILSK